MSRILLSMLSIILPTLYSVCTQNIFFSIGTNNVYNGMAIAAVYGNRNCTRNII